MLLLAPKILSSCKMGIYNLQVNFAVIKLKLHLTFIWWNGHIAFIILLRQRHAVSHRYTQLCLPLQHSAIHTIKQIYRCVWIALIPLGRWWNFFLKQLSQAFSLRIYTHCCFFCDFVNLICNIIVCSSLQSKKPLVLDVFHDSINCTGLYSSSFFQFVNVLVIWHRDSKCLFSCSLWRIPFEIG